MNNTLPTFWHNTFISSQLNKILMQKQHEELLKLSIEIKNHYKPPISALGFKNYLIIRSAQNKIAFSTLTNFFKAISKVKYTLRSFIK